jgi:hypothetical protein
VVFLLEAIPAVRYIFVRERREQKMPLPSGLGQLMGYEIIIY